MARSKKMPARQLSDSVLQPEFIEIKESMTKYSDLDLPEEIVEEVEHKVRDIKKRMEAWAFHLGILAGKLKQKDKNYIDAVLDLDNGVTYKANRAYLRSRDFIDFLNMNPKLLDMTKAGKLKASWELYCENILGFSVSFVSECIHIASVFTLKDAEEVDHTKLIEISRQSIQKGDIIRKVSKEKRFNLQFVHEVLEITKKKKLTLREVRRLCTIKRREYGLDGDSSPHTEIIPVEPVLVNTKKYRLEVPNIENLDPVNENEDLILLHLAKLTKDDQKLIKKLVDKYLS